MAGGSLEHAALGASAREMRVEVQRRNSSSHWEIHEFAPGRQVALEALGIPLSLDALYENPWGGQQ